jgi:peptidoglycan hydrolase CwlO-like protein
MDESLNIRQNQDLIKSLNEIYEMNIKIQKEIEQIQTEMSDNNQSQTDRIRQVNNMVMESKNIFGQQVRSIQNEMGNGKELGDKIDGVILEMDALKGEINKMRNRMNALNNDMIVMQGNIISNGGEKINLQVENRGDKMEADNGGYFSKRSGKYIPVETYNNHPFNGILNPKTKI